MKRIRSPILIGPLMLAACGQAVDPAPPEERLRAEAERAAALEAAEREILNAGLPLPDEAGPALGTTEVGVGGLNVSVAE